MFGLNLSAFAPRLAALSSTEASLAANLGAVLALAPTTAAVDRIIGTEVIEDADPEPTAAFVTATLDIGATRQVVVPAPTALVTRASVDIPVIADPDDPARIVQAAPSAPRWLARGWKIRSVNGTPVDSIDDARNVAAASVASFGTPDVTVAIGLESPTGVAVRPQTYQAQIVRQIALPSGLTFETRLSDDGWVTNVASLPASGES
ncbi:MAG: hypothetical protein AAFR44_15845, partial [Pseudomonadota bacterium]